MNKFNIGDMVYIARISSGARRIMVWKKSFEIKGIKKDSTELKYLIDNEWESECNIYTDKDEVSAAVNKALNDLSDEEYE